ncbi:MAG: (2Fe-2S)-binding protein, partial [Bosea sp. (in: a-proteobacteria)]
TSLVGLFCAGDAGGIGGAVLADIDGRRAAAGVANHLGRMDAAARDVILADLARMAKAHASIRPFLNAVYQPRQAVHVPPDDVVVCRCEEVTARTIRDAVKAGCLGSNQVKSFTRCGMGPCQGRQCAVTLRQIVADARGKPVAEVEPLTIRPPLKPLTLGELASLAAAPGNDR